jgi:hypothetical protein
MANLKLLTSKYKNTPIQILIQTDIQTSPFHIQTLENFSKNK